jgi:hypothetical protein
LSSHQINECNSVESPKIRLHPLFENIAFTGGPPDHVKANDKPNSGTLSGNQDFELDSKFDFLYSDFS